MTFPCPDPSQVIEMPEHNPGQMGGTMRLGKRKTVFTNKDSLMSESPLQHSFSVPWGGREG